MVMVSKKVNSHLDCRQVNKWGLNMINWEMLILNYIVESRIFKGTCKEPFH